MRRGLCAFTDAESATPSPRPLTHYDGPVSNVITRLSVEKQTAVWIELPRPAVSLARQIIRLMTVGRKVDFQDAALSLTCVLSKAKDMFMTMGVRILQMRW